MELTQDAQIASKNATSGHIENLDNALFGLTVHCNKWLGTVSNSTNSLAMDYPLFPDVKSFAKVVLYKLDS